MSNTQETTTRQVLAVFTSEQLREELELRETEDLLEREVAVEAEHGLDGFQLGDLVHLDEDVYAEHPQQTPPRVFRFEAYDAEAPADVNCTVVDVATGDWTVRGLEQLVPVDEDALELQEPVEF